MIVILKISVWSQPWCKTIQKYRSGLLVCTMGLYVSGLQLTFLVRSGVRSNDRPRGVPGRAQKRDGTATGLRRPQIPGRGGEASGVRAFVFVCTSFSGRNRLAPDERLAAAMSRKIKELTAGTQKFPRTFRTGTADGRSRANNNRR